MTTPLCSLISLVSTFIWKTDPMLENKDIKNPNFISRVLLLGLILLFFKEQYHTIIRYFILSLYSAGRILLFFPYCLQTHHRRQRRQRAVQEHFPQAAALHRALCHKASSKSLWHCVWPLSELLLVSLFWHAVSSSVYNHPELLCFIWHMVITASCSGTAHHRTWPSCPKCHSRLRDRSRHPFCLLE